MGPIHLRRSLCVALTILGWAIGGCDKPATSGGGAGTPPPAAAPSDLSTPEAAAKTFFAAVERKDVAAVERAMSTELRQKLVKEGSSVEKVVNGLSEEWARKKASFVSPGKMEERKPGSTDPSHYFPYTMKIGGQEQQAGTLSMVKEGAERRLDRL
jgi:hypothetical protein